jgi:hypothetical protein
MRDLGMLILRARPPVTTTETGENMESYLGNVQTGSFPWFRIFVFLHNVNE